ncbi:MAG: hypothetical protein WJ306_08710 [Ferrovum myxofaciens]
MVLLASTTYPLFRCLNSWLSPGGSTGSLSILIYHRVLPKPDPLFPDEVDAQRFDAQLNLLKNVFHILPLPEAVERLKTMSCPRALPASPSMTGMPITPPLHSHC